MDPIEKMKNELEQMGKRGSDLRWKFSGGVEFPPENSEELIKFNQAVKQTVEPIIQEYGWPGISLVGWDAGIAVAECVRYCWSEPEFIRSNLIRVEQACRMGDIPGDWFVRIYDATMVYRGKLQVFGTWMEWNEAGTWGPGAVVDEPMLQSRRALLNLEPLEVQIERDRQEVVRNGSKPPLEFGVSLEIYRSKRAAFFREFGWK